MEEGDRTPEFCHDWSVRENHTVAQKVRCPLCSKVHTVTPKVQGRKVSCKCGKVFRMPGVKVGPARLAKEEVERVAGPPTGETIEVFCAACGQGYRVQRSLAGQSGKCACGATFKIPFEEQAAPAPVGPAGPSDFNNPAGGPSGATAFEDPFASAPTAPVAADPLDMDYDFDFDAVPAPTSVPPAAAPGLAPPLPGQAMQNHAVPVTSPAPAHQPPVVQPAISPSPVPSSPLAPAPVTRGAQTGGMHADDEVQPIAFAPPPAGVPSGGLPGDPLGPPGLAAPSYGAPAPVGNGYWNRPGTSALAGGPQKKSRRDAYKKSKKNKKKAGGGGGDVPMSAIGNMGFGILLGILGIGATAVSYNMADAGEEYTIWVGAIVWGAIHFFIGIVQLVTGD